MGVALNFCFSAREEYLLIENPHDPFERIQFWQFIQILIVLSWHLYGQYVICGTPLVVSKKVTDFLQYFEAFESPHVLKTALEYFITKDVFKDRFHEDWSPSPTENKLEEINLAPMEAMYLIYCSVGEPHSARDLINVIFHHRKDEEKTYNVRYYEKLPFHKIDGKNALTVAGELQHMPKQDPFNFPEISQLEENKEKIDPKSELYCFHDLKPKRVLKCLIEVCPAIANDDCIVNIDYQLTFLEFYKTIILCTKLQLKLRAINEIRDEIIGIYKVQLEEYQKQLNEFEKENLAVSRKKSRQLSELSKKGRK